MDRLEPNQELCARPGSQASGAVEGKLPPEYSTAIDEHQCDEDLYRGADEIEEERKSRDETQWKRPSSFRVVGGDSSVADAVDLLTYSEREWRGNTVKSTLIRKGYLEVFQTYEGLRRVRGDNYCALRATLFQLLTRSKCLPAWLQDEDMLQSKKLLSDNDLIGQWRFPFEKSSNSASGGAVELLVHYLKQLRRRWQSAVLAPSALAREGVCQQVFQGLEEEYGLLEALKFHMFRTAMALHGLLKRGVDVPEFCWLLFARDTSSCPQSFLKNHLQHVGFSGGLEQVEMFLLGYSIEHTIQVYRLYKADTEEFITYYPDDHRKDWPCLSLLTEDDRHYNVPVAKLQRLHLPDSHSSS